MNIIQELEHIRALSKQIDSKIRQSQSLKSYYNFIKAQDYSKEKISGGRKTDFTDTVVKIVDLDNIITKEIDDLCDLKRNLNDAIKSKIHGLEYVVIQMYYFEELRIEEIAVKLNYSYSQIKRYKRNGLRKLKDDPQ